MGAAVLGFLAVVLVVAVVVATSASSSGSSINVDAAIRYVTNCKGSALVTVTDGAETVVGSARLRHAERVGVRLLGADLLRRRLSTKCGTGRRIQI